MRLSHNFSAEFDDDNLIATGGLVPVMLLAESAGLSGLVDEYVTVASSAGANAQVKVGTLVVGMVAGADSISDMDLLRHGGMGRAFTEHRAPTTLGTHLRGYTFGHVRQLDAIASRLLVALAARVPALLRGADEMAYLDIDDTMRETHGYAKQGTGYGYSGVKGLNALVATISTPTAAPVIAGIRLRKGSTKSARGAGKMIAEALAAARQPRSPTPTSPPAGKPTTSLPGSSCARQAPEPDHCHRRAGRAAGRLPPPRGLHRLAPGDAGG